MSDQGQGSIFTPEQIQYWLAHESDTQVPNIIACASVCGFFATLFVFARVIGRRWHTGSWRLLTTDWLVTVAWVFYIADLVSVSMGTRYGIGRHVIFITDLWMVQVWSLISEAFYGVCMGFLKFSILALYASVFPDRRFRMYLWIVGVFIFGWMTTAALGSILQCVPIAKAHDSTLPGYCIDVGKMNLAVGICNVITDFVIIVMPIPLVRKLHTSAEKKRIIILTFAAGGGAVFVSIVRLVFSLKVGSIDGSWEATPAAYTSMVELLVGFLVVSIPVYRKMWRKATGGDADGSTAWSYRIKSDGVPLRPSKGTSPYNSKKNASGYSNSSVPNSRGADNDVSIGHTTTVGTVNDERDPMPLRGVRVKHDVELVKLGQKNGTWSKLPDEPGKMV